MTVHTDWKRNKPGLFDKQIQEARRVRQEAFMQVPEHKRSLLKVMYSGRRGITQAVNEHFEWIFASEESERHRLYQKCSEHGDFTNCYRGGFC